MCSSFKVALVAIVSLVLSGCAITEVVAVTGMSYLLTGKSVSDNALSMVTNKDCALHNLLSDEPICEPEILVASVKQAPKVSAKVIEDPDTLVAMGGDKTAKPDGEMLANNQKTLTSTVIEPQLYAVVGSFTQIAYAQYRKKLYTGFNPMITEVGTPSKPTYRVVIGPLNNVGEINTLPSKIDTETFAPWIIKLCGDELSPAPCESGLLAKLTN